MALHYSGLILSYLGAMWLCTFLSLDKDLQKCWKSRRLRRFVPEKLLFIAERSVPVVILLGGLSGWVFYMYTYSFWY